MGVDCRIMLPDNVRIRDVADAIGVAVGFQPVMKPLSGGSYHVDVPGISASSVDLASSPELARIEFDGRHVLYFFESEYGGRLLFPKSTAFWCLVGHRLVDLFGGSVDYNDCDDSEVDYSRRKKSDALNRPSDGAAWHSLQDRIAAVPPITREEMENFKGDVGYPQDNYPYTYDDDGRMVRGRTKSEQVLLAAD